MHHIICDGLSLAYLARDLMQYLGDPEREVEVLPPPVPIAPDNMPPGLSVNRIVKFFINRINKKWAREAIYFDQQDYQALSQAYWQNFHHRMISVEFLPHRSSFFRR